MLNLMCVTNAFCRGRVSRPAGMHFFRESLINVESEKIGTCKAADAEIVITTSAVVIFLNPPSAKAPIAGKNDSEVKTIDWT